MDKFNPADLASMLTAALEASQNTSGEAATQPVSEAEETKAEETKAVAEEI